MNESNSNSGQLTAISYVETELAQARALLRHARLWAAISVVFVLGYMTFVTTTLYRRLLEPKPAAEVMTHYISAFVQQEGPVVSRRLINDVPKVVAQAPDYLLAQLPGFRVDLETKIEKSLAAYGREITPQLAAVVDDFLVKNQEPIRKLVGQASDPKLVHELGDQFEQRVLGYLDAKGPNGASAMDRLTESAQAMKLAEARMHRLAYANDLTPEEKQLRRIWGLILQQANRPESRKTTS